MDIQQGDSSQFQQSTQLIQSNSEYLTLVRSLVNQKAKNQNNAYRTLESYMQSFGDSKTKLNFEQLCQLMVQLGYFLWTCKNFGMKPLIEVSEIKVEQISIRNYQKRFSVVIFYKLQQGQMEDMQALTLFGGILEHLQTNLANILQNKEVNQNDLDFINFQHFMQQYRQISNCSFFQSNQTYFFKALEQTNLFYQYSILYRIKNSSTLDQIQSNPNKMKLFKEYQHRDQKLLAQFNQEKKKFRNDNQSLRAKQKQITSSLLEFFQKINQSFSEGPPTKNEKEQSNKISFGFVSHQKQKESFEAFLSKLQQNEDAMSEESKVKLSRPLGEMNYFIEYTPQKNTICVRLVMPTLAVNVDTSDFIMFQSNVLTFEAVSVSIEISEPKLMKIQSPFKVPPKMVIFKGTSSFNVKQPPFEKILLLMDITMIASKIYEPELNPMKNGQGKDTYHKLTTVSRKVTHYTKLFMRCAKKIYGE